MPGIEPSVNVGIYHEHFPYYTVASAAQRPAPGKGNTLLNYCSIRSDLIEYLVDRYFYKHGKLTPGARLPIHPVERVDLRSGGRP
jgi:C-methyltransferase C-terminal domain